jgi:hypothetical protein
MMTKRDFAFTVALVLIACQITFLALVSTQVQESGVNPNIDFTVFWGAAKLALYGDAISVFDWRALSAAQNLGPEDMGGSYYWWYPPTFHMLISPFGALPFIPAFAVFSVLGLTVYGLAIRASARDLPAASIYAFASPAVLVTLLVGNNSLFWVAAFLGALHFAAHGREVRAGVLIGLLTLKPQLGLALLVALIASGSWRVIAWATLSAAIVGSLALVVFGADYWALFFGNIADTASPDTARSIETANMITWYALAIELGLDRLQALSIHGVAAGIAAVAVAIIWSRRDEDTNLRIAVLCLATIVVTPYAYAYELVLAGVVVLFRPNMAWLWFLPIPAWVVPGLDIANYVAPVLTVSLLILVLPKALKRHRSNPPTPSMEKNVE